jgi:hypothetical protein
MTGDDCLLQLIIDPALEDALTDWLLDLEDIQGFSSVAASGHGASPHSMTLAEQVSGRQRRTLFMLNLPRERAAWLLERFHAAFPDSGAHFWILPVLDSGTLGGD